MIRRRRRIRNSKSQNNARRCANTVLTSIGVQAGTREVGLQVINLREAPRQIFPQNDIYAAASGQRKGVLAAVPGHGRPCVRANQDFRERYEAVSAEIQARSKQVGGKAALLRRITADRG
jgi:hypothetical protein